jgi:catechol 2,3-dioxygenase-like lactoylglutathione lyase family enzyme
VTPTFTGVHHLKFPVSDMSASIAWFEAALGATRLTNLDHLDRDGNLFVVIMMLPGLEVPTGLRLAPTAAAAVAGYDPVTFGVADNAALDDWISHLDAVGVEHSPVIAGFVGHLIEFRTPDGLAIRVYTDLTDGLAKAKMRRPEQADIDNPWVNPSLMARPKAGPSGP